MVERLKMDVKVELLVLIKHKGLQDIDANNAILIYAKNV